MSSWNLLSTDGGDYRWELSGRNPATHSGNKVHGYSATWNDSSASRLPSMSDLLVQGRSELLEHNGSSNSGSSPLFRTALGKPVKVKQSSIAKVMQVLGDDDFPYNVVDGHISFYFEHLVLPWSWIQQTRGANESPVGNGGCRDGASSLFQTGSGKMVNVSPEGLLRAKTLQGLGEDDEHCASQVLRCSREPFFNDKENRSLNSSDWGKDHAKFADVVEDKPVLGFRLAGENGPAENRLKHIPFPKCAQSQTGDPPAKPAPIKFQTAGGRSVSVSTDALKRARSLLGDPELGSFINDVGLCEDPSNKENEPPVSLQYQGTPNPRDVPKSFISPALCHFSSGRRYLNSSKKLTGGSNLIGQFDAAASDSPDRSGSALVSHKRPLKSGSFAAIDPSEINDCDSRNNCHGSSPIQVLMDISNRKQTSYSNNEIRVSEKRFVSNNSVTPFKRPRSSKFSTPLKRNSSLAPNGDSALDEQASLSTSSVQAPLLGRVSTRYPPLLPRLSMKEYFGGRLLHMDSPDSFGGISSDEAGKFIFSDQSGLNSIGVEAFFHMLIQSGASVQHLSKIWVTNHYRWIVWKLACYDGCLPAKTVRKFLTISNVLEELKYRYEREINHGHRSAIKRILEGDASPSSMLVLCVSAIYADSDLNNEGSSVASEGNCNRMRLELTDGWYSVDAVLDDLLSNHCNSGKVFVGQKLRIWGARLYGWTAPVSPLEATKTVRLLVHANGTYRTHWADRLGFCKGRCAPLAFRCIKSNGGPVPQTLVGVTRIYPVLYKERLSSGGSIVISERMELEIRMRHKQRRSAIIDGVICESHRATVSHLYDDSGSEEGAKISKILEAAAEPEFLMAEMSPDQLNAFSTYRSKMEATRHSDMEKSIEKALQDAGLAEREVTQFLRVRVVGLRSRNNRRNCGPENGLITIWNPNQSQQHDLVEGRAYVFSGLIPVNAASDTIYLHTRGSTAKWRPLTLQDTQNFRPFFDPRKAICLSRFDEVPLSSEFDIAGFIIHVGEVFTAAQQRKQWVFVTDGSIVGSQYGGELSSSLLAICFCWHYIDDLSLIPFNTNLAGSTVGFCNLIKRPKDQMNHIWVADATENTTYSLTFDSPRNSHLKDAAISTQRWAKISDLIISKLRERVSFIIGD